MTRTTNIDGVSCEVCGKQRKPGLIHARESKLLRGQKLMMCTVCESEGKEPRWLIIIVARTRGPGAVTEYIKHHRYSGDPIKAKEIV